MQGMIQRYRDRLTNSSTQIKALSASRQKSLNNNNINSQSNIQVVNTIPSNQSLTKNKHSLIQLMNTTNQKQQQYQQNKQLNNDQNNTLNNNLVLTQSLVTENSQLKNINNNSNIKKIPSLPSPQPIVIHTNTNNKQKLKQSTVSISTPIVQLKSSRKTNTNMKSNKQISKNNQPNNNKRQQRQKHKQKQKYQKKQQQNSILIQHRSKSKSKRKSSLRVNNQNNNLDNNNNLNNNNNNPSFIQLKITPQQLTQNISQSIYQVFVNQIKQKNLSINIIPLINKQQLKYKVSIFLEEYFSRRCQLTQKERVYKMGNSLVEKNTIQYNDRHKHQLPDTQTILPSSSLSYPVLLSTSSANTFTNQLQRRFFESQKQRQFLQKKVQSLGKKVQSLTKQLQRYSKMQRLINNTIQGENEARREVNRLRKELQYSKLKNSQQQKMWRKQTLEMRQMMDELRQQLIKKYNNDNDIKSNNNDSQKKKNNRNSNKKRHGDDYQQQQSQQQQGQRERYRQ